MLGKYSPTISNWYSCDQDWFKKNCKELGDIYDKDGYDSYGYDKNGMDRAGHKEYEYMAPYLNDDESTDNLYENIWLRWNDEPVPSFKK